MVCLCTHSLTSPYGCCCSAYTHTHTLYLCLCSICSSALRWQKREEYQIIIIISSGHLPLARRACLTRFWRARWREDHLINLIISSFCACFVARLLRARARHFILKTGKGAGFGAGSWRWYAGRWKDKMMEVGSSIVCLCSVAYAYSFGGIARRGGGGACLRCLPIYWVVVTGGVCAWLVTSLWLAYAAFLLVPAYPFCLPALPGRLGRQEGRRKEEQANLYNLTCHLYFSGPASTLFALPPSFFPSLASVCMKKEKESGSSIINQ